MPHPLRPAPSRSRGKIAFDGKPLNSVPAHKIVALGLAPLPQRPPASSPASPSRRTSSSAPSSARTGKASKRTSSAPTSLFPILGERQKQAAGTLSGGEQQMLAMGRALMSQPKLLMLDEPSMGLSPIMMQKILATIVELKASGTTILLVEQNAQAALSLADQGHVMEVGNIVLSGYWRGPAARRVGTEGVPRRGLGPFRSLPYDEARAPAMGARASS
ncbi:ABC transporter ATP-binding protein [Streptomyces sp. L7]